MTSSAGKDAGAPKERLPRGQKFMPRVCLERLVKVWKDEPAGKSKQVGGMPPQERGAGHPQHGERWG